MTLRELAKNVQNMQKICKKYAKYAKKYAKYAKYAKICKKKCSFGRVYIMILHIYAKYAPGTLLMRLRLDSAVTWPRASTSANMKLYTTFAESR